MVLNNIVSDFIECDKSIDFALYLFDFNDKADW